MSKLSSGKEPRADARHVPSLSAEQASARLEKTLGARWRALSDAEKSRLVASARASFQEAEQRKRLAKADPGTSKPSADPARETEKTTHAPAERAPRERRDEALAAPEAASAQPPALVPEPTPAPSPADPGPPAVDGPLLEEAELLDFGDSDEEELEPTFFYGRPAFSSQQHVPQHQHVFLPPAGSQGGRPPSAGTATYPGEVPGPASVMSGDPNDGGSVVRGGFGGGYLAGGGGGGGVGGGGGGFGGGGDPPGSWVRSSAAGGSKTVVVSEGGRSTPDGSTNQQGHLGDVTQVNSSIFDDFDG